MSYLCPFVHVAIFVHKLVVITSMSGIVQLAFMKSLAVWDDFEIYADTVWLVVALQLAQIQVDNFYSFNDNQTCNRLGKRVDDILLER